MSRVAGVLAGSFAVLVACTSAPASPNIGSGTPSSTVTRSTSVASSPSPPSVIELPALPETGLAAGWSRANAEGVSLVDLRGHTFATVHDAGIYSADRVPPGLVILVMHNDEYWLLDVSAHELRRISAYRAEKLVSERGSASLPHDALAWSVSAPAGPQVLGQYWQQVSECQKPVAVIRPAPGSPLQPVTGDPLINAQPSYALGWVDDDKALVSVARGPCDAGTARFREGVYLFSSDGDAQRLRVPPGSYFFQMWG